MNEQSCPISTDLVNTKLTRTYSFITFLAISFYLFTPFKEVIYISTLDFIIRVFVGVKYSPICFLIREALKIGNISPQMVNSGPKKFAAKIGLLFTVLMSISTLAGFGYTSIVLGVIFFTAVGAEAIFGFCVACYIHSFLPSSWK